MHGINSEAIEAIMEHANNVANLLLLEDNIGIDPDAYKLICDYKAVYPHLCHV